MVGCPPSLQQQQLQQIQIQQSADGMPVIQVQLNVTFLMRYTLIYRILPIKRTLPNKRTPPPPIFWEKIVRRAIPTSKFWVITTFSLTFFCSKSTTFVYVNDVFPYINHSPNIQ